MKIIEKENGQIFEICNKSEFIQQVKEYLRDFNPDIDNDITIHVILDTGKEIVIGYLSPVEKFNKQWIVSGSIDNGTTYVIFNKEIVYNEKYDDYEVTDINLSEVIKMSSRIKLRLKHYELTRKGEFQKAGRILTFLLRKKIRLGLSDIDNDLEDLFHSMKIRHKYGRRYGITFFI